MSPAWEKAKHGKKQQKPKICTWLEKTHLQAVGSKGQHGLGFLSS